MNNIGFDGGGLVCELGPRSDVTLFFDCLTFFPFCNKCDEPVMETAELRSAEPGERPPAALSSWRAQATRAEQV